jgi:hypothetical protein
MKGHGMKKNIDVQDLKKRTSLPKLLRGCVSCCKNYHDPFSEEEARVLERMVDILDVNGIKSLSQLEEAIYTWVSK